MNFNVIRIAKTLPNKRTSLVQRNLKCSRTSAGLVEVRFPTQMCLIFVLPSGSEICARALVVFRRPTLNTIHCCSLLLMTLSRGGALFNNRVIFLLARTQQVLFNLHQHLPSLKILIWWSHNFGGCQRAAQNRNHGWISTAS